MDDFNMWSYWVGKYGPLEALQLYFPKTLAENPKLQHAVYDIEAKLAVIEKFMNEKEREADGN
jgi:hypothetical protein